MVTVKMLKPYYIKMSEEYVRVILAYQYFSIVIHNQVYQFVPMEEKEIRISRRTQEVVNTDATFAFQRGKDIIYVTMKKLISLPDFLIQLHSIVQPYYEQPISDDESSENSEDVIKQLERLNVKRLIDKALDEKDENAFYSLSRLL